MKFPLFYIISLSIALTIISCRENNDDIQPIVRTKAMGQVQTGFSNAPVPFAKVWLYEIGSGGFYSTYKVIGDTTADVFGNYGFEFDCKSDNSYSLDAAAYKHFRNSMDELTKVPEGTTNININVSIPGFAIVKFRIMKKNPASGFSMHEVFDFDGKSHNIYLSPFPVDTVVYRVRPGGINNIYYTVLYGDSFIVKNIKTELVPHDTNEINIIH